MLGMPCVWSYHSMVAFKDKEIVWQLFDLARKFECHELTEWFKYEGACFVEPHPELEKDELTAVTK